MKRILIVILSCLSSTALFSQAITAIRTDKTSINANIKESGNETVDVTVTLNLSGESKKDLGIRLEISPDNLAPKPKIENPLIIITSKDFRKKRKIALIKITQKELDCLEKDQTFIIKPVKNTRVNVNNGVQAAIIIGKTTVTTAPAIWIESKTSTVQPFLKSDKKDDGLRAVAMNLVLSGKKSDVGVDVPLQFEIPIYQSSRSNPKLPGNFQVTIPADAFNDNGCPNNFQVAVAVQLSSVEKQKNDETVHIILKGDQITLSNRKTIKIDQQKHAHTILISGKKPEEEKPTGAEPSTDSPKKGYSFSHACSNGKNFFITMRPDSSIGGTIEVQEVVEKKTYSYQYYNFYHSTDFSKWLLNIFTTKIRTGPHNDCISYIAERVNNELLALSIKKMSQPSTSGKTASSAGKDTATVSTDSTSNSNEKSKGKNDVKTVDTKPDTMVFQKTYIYNDTLYNLVIKKFENKTLITISDKDNNSGNSQIITGKMDSTVFDITIKDLIHQLFSSQESVVDSGFKPSLRTQQNDYLNKIAATEKKEKEKDAEAINRKRIEDYESRIKEMEDDANEPDKVAGRMLLRKKVNLYKDGLNGQRIPAGHLEVISGRLQTDNNKIFDITFAAKYYDKDGNMIHDSLPISNNEFSLSFKGLNNREFTNTISSRPKTYSKKEKARYAIEEEPFFNYGDVIRYLPYKENFSSIIKNKTYDLSPDSTTKIHRRRYSDYLSFRTFLDPLGFLGNNPNGFIQLEGDAVIPANVRNYKWRTWLPELHANFSYIYANTLNSEKRVARSLYLPNDSFFIYNNVLDSFVKRADSANYIQNLDIVRNAYYQMYIRASIISFEVKRQNSWFNIELGIRIFGANVDKKIDTSVRRDTSKYHKIIPEINLKWMFRPDNIFGAELNLGVAWLSNIHRANNNPFRVNDPSFLWKSGFAVPHELNIYVQTGKESKGGLFFRYSGWWSINSKLAKSIDERLLPQNAQTRKTAYFPQILFGYSTNLSTMIKSESK